MVIRFKQCDLASVVLMMIHENVLFGVAMRTIDIVEQSGIYALLNLRTSAYTRERLIRSIRPFHVFYADSWLTRQVSMRKYKISLHKALYWLSV